MSPKGMRLFNNLWGPEAEGFRQPLHDQAESLMEEIRKEILEHLHLTGWEQEGIRVMELLLELLCTCILNQVQIIRRNAQNFIRIQNEFTKLRDRI